MKAFAVFVVLFVLYCQVGGRSVEKGEVKQWTFSISTFFSFFCALIYFYCNVMGESRPLMFGLIYFRSKKGAMVFYGVKKVK